MVDQKVGKMINGLSVCAVIAVLLLLFFVGYRIGKDLAARHNRIKAGTSIEQSIGTLGGK